MKEYIFDASVAVKWLNQEREPYTQEAFALLEGLQSGNYRLVAPELCISEVCNALIYGKKLSGLSLEKAIDSFFSLPLQFISMTYDLSRFSALIADNSKMTFYDAVYVALAHIHEAVLITANAKHQKKFSTALVIDLKDISL